MSPPITPDRTTKHREADIVKESRFFEAFDSRTRDEGALQSLESLAIKYDITKRTACNWLKQRQIQGSPAYRRSRQLSQRLDRKQKLTNDQI
jgi:hypothetical protein